MVIQRCLTAPATVIWVLCVYPIYYIVMRDASSLVLWPVRSIYQQISADLKHPWVCYQTPLMLRFDWSNNNFFFLYPDKPSDDDTSSVVSAFDFEGFASDDEVSGLGATTWQWSGNNNTSALDWEQHHLNSDSSRDGWSSGQHARK